MADASAILLKILTAGFAEIEPGGGLMIDLSGSPAGLTGDEVAFVEQMLRDLSGRSDGDEPMSDGERVQILRFALFNIIGAAESGLTNGETLAEWVVDVARFNLDRAADGKPTEPPSVDRSNTR